MVNETAPRFDHKQVRERLETDREQVLLQLADETSRHDLTMEIEPESGDTARIISNQIEHSALVHHLLKRAEKIRVALQRLQEGSYGLCLTCGAAIPSERLEALPEAVLCVACQQSYDRTTL